MRAVLKPKVQSPHAQDHLVTCLARTGNRKIKVERASDRAIFAVDRFRLRTEGYPSRGIGAEEFAALPWAGKGPDPDRGAAGDLLDQQGVQA